MAGRRRSTALLALLAALALAAGAGAEPIQRGNLRIGFDARFAPRSLPRERAVPVKISLRSTIATTDGSQPPPLRGLRIALNRHGRFAAGLPRCAAGELQSQPPAAALARCRAALVGRGRYRAEIAAGAGRAPVAVRGRVLAFNAARGRAAAILLVLYSRAPVPQSTVVALAISRARGELGTVLSARVPLIAGGAGSVTALSLRIGRTYRRGGRRVGYLSASCAAPPGFRAAPFVFSRAEFRFAGGRRLRVTVSRSCRVR